MDSLNRKATAQVVIIAQLVQIHQQSSYAQLENFVLKELVLHWNVLMALIQMSVAVLSVILVLQVITV